jgi:hypothetical protein
LAAKKIVYSSALATVVAVLIYLSSIPGVRITTSGDITCSVCTSYFNITSSNYSLKFYKFDQRLTFSPEIKNYTLYRYTYGKWRETKFPINMTKGTLYRFKLVGYKFNPSDKIKWAISSGDAEIDPYWLGEKEVKLASTIYHPDYDEEVYSDGSTKWSFIGQGLRNVYEDGKWKKAENARSWKDYLGYIEKIYLEKDPGFDMDIVDINATFAELNLTFNSSDFAKYPECSASKTNDIKCDFKFTVKEENGTETKFQYKYQDKDGVKTDLKYVLKGNPFDYEYTFGGNSTTIKFNNGNVTDDTHLYQKGQGGDYGADDDLVAAGVATTLNFPIIKIKWNGVMPANQEILDAQLALYVEAELLDTGESWNYDAKHVYDRTKYNISGSEWTEGGSTATAGCAEIGGATTGTEINWTYSPNEPNIEYNDTYETRVTDAAAGTSSVWYKWAVTNMVRTEYMAGRNNVSILLNVSIGAGTPDNTDCVYFTSAEGTNKPYLNITFQPDQNPPTWSLNQTNSTIAGSWIKHSLNWTDTAQSGVTPGLSGYIFSFCNGTWDGTCPGLCPQIYTITLNETNKGNVGDSSTRSFFPLVNDGATTVLYAGYTTTNTEKNILWLLWNLSVIPPGSIITNANMSLYTTTVNTDPILGAWNTSTYNSTGGGPWTEGTKSGTAGADMDIAWRNQPSTGTFQSNNGSKIALSKRVHFNVTNATIATFSNANQNMSIMVTNNTKSAINIIVYLESKEVATASERPQLTITYQVMGDCGWINDTLVAFNSNTWSNVSKAVNSTTGAHMAWRVYANDTSNNWNASSVFTYDTTGGETTTTTTTTTTSSTSTTTTIPANCWTYESTNKVLIIPSGCVYHNDTVGII